MAFLEVVPTWEGGHGAPIRRVRRELGTFGSSKWFGIDDVSG